MAGTPSNPNKKTETAFGPSDAQNAQAVQALGGSSSQRAVIDDPYQLSQQGLGDLRNQPIHGSQEFFSAYTGIPPYSTTAGKRVGLKGQLTKHQGGFPQSYLQTPNPDMTAQETVDNFVGLTGANLAKIQDQLYRGGMYSANFIPKYGVLQDQDIAAFRKMIIGLAANPRQGTLSNYLSNVAQIGTAQGTAGAGAAGKVIALTSPDELRVTLQKTVQDLYGGNLPEDQVQQFISSYQGMESAAQNAAATNKASSDFESGLMDPTTGQARGSLGGVSTTVIKPPGATDAAESYVRKNFPNQVAATQFGNAMQGIMSILKNPGV